MTARALIKALPYDVDRVRDGLRRRVVGRGGVLGGRAVELTAEPLLRQDAAGTLRQSIRVVVAAGMPRPSRAVVRTASGSVVPALVEPGPAGIRLLVPAVDVLTPLTVELPELAAGEHLGVELTPQRRWTVHLIHHSHLDIGYTDPQGTVLAEHTAFLDSCLDLAAATDDWPDEARFRWCVESLWSFEQWARLRPPERVAELVRRVRAGSVELSAMPYNVHSEACSTDELHELLRGARRIRDRWGVEFRSAMQTDVPGAVAGLPDALGEVGVRYLSVAHNWAGRSVPHLVGGQDLPRLFRWRGAGGHEVLVWLTDTPHGLAYMEGPMLGFDTSFDLVDDLLPCYLSSLATNPYPYDAGLFGWALDDAELHRRPYPWDVLHLRVQGRFADNAPPRLIMAETVRRWNEKWSWPRLRLSVNSDFFHDAAGRLGDEIQTFEGDWNDWWADGVGSGARPLSLHRRAQAVVAEAQTIASMTPGSAEAAAACGQATETYQALGLFDEHTWGAGDPWTDGDEGMASGDQQWHWKYAQAIRAHDGAAQLLDRAQARLGAELGAAPGALASFTVVNTCSWDRTDVVSAFLPESVVPVEQPVEVVDARTGKALPVRELAQRNPDHRNAGRFLQAVVADVPGIGLARLDVRSAAGPASAASAGGVGPAAGGEPTVLENEHLLVRVDLARACIASIVDKATGRELVATDAAVGFNGYLYDRYTSAGGFNHLSSRLVATDRLELLGSRSAARPAALLERTSTATGERLVYEAAADGARWLRTTLVLWHGVPRLDIDNRLAKDATMAKEGAYLAFPFALDHPTVRVEVTGGMVGDGIPAVPGGATHMRAMRRWVSLEQDGYAVAWASHDAALVQLGQISLPYAPFPPTLEPEPGTVFSWVHNNLWDTNFPPQQGFEMSYRYSVAAGPVAAVGAGPTLGMRTAAGVGHPLRAAISRAAGQPSAQTRLVAVDDPRVRVVGLTVPRPGQLLVRLQSFAETPAEVGVRVRSHPGAAYRCTYLGDPFGEPLDRVDGAARVRVPARAVGAVLFVEDRVSTG